MHHKSIFGFPWQVVSPGAAFLFGAMMSWIAVDGLQVLLPKSAVSRWLL